MATHYAYIFYAKCVLGADGLCHFAGVGEEVRDGFAFVGSASDGFGGGGLFSGACFLHRVGFGEHRLKSVPRLLPEELLDQLFFRYVQIIGDVAEDFGECANAKLFVDWDCDVVFVALSVRCEADVAAGLARDLVAEAAQ